jgi:hypothetical protein
MERKCILHEIIPGPIPENCEKGEGSRVIIYGLEITGSILVEEYLLPSLKL